MPPGSKGEADPKFRQETIRLSPAALYLINFSNPPQTPLHAQCEADIFGNFGLSDSNKNLKLSDESASSKLTDSNEGYLVSVRDISEVIDELKLKNIDLLKSNIEGAEYDLLSRLIETNKISIINSLQIQYHKDHIQNAEILRAKINDKLLDTHKNIWSYYFVWERWDLNN